MPVIFSFDLVGGGQHNHISSFFQRFGWQNLGGSSYRYPKLGTDQAVEDWFNHVIPALMLFRSYVVQHQVDIRYSLDVQSSTGYNPSTNFGNPPLASDEIEFYSASIQQFGARKLRDWIDGVDYPY